MKLVVVCGMPSEAAVIKAALPGALVLSGTAKNNLDALVPRDATHIASVGLCGGLEPSVAVPDVCLASNVVDDTGHVYPVTPLWTFSLLSAIRTASVDNDVRALTQPTWAQRARRMPWYSDGKFGDADTADKRAALWKKSGAWCIDDETIFVARFAHDWKLPFAVLRTVSDSATETLPPAAREAIVNPNGSPDIAKVFAAIRQESFADTLDLLKVAADFNAALAVLQAAAPYLLQSLM